MAGPGTSNCADRLVKDLSDSAKHLLHSALAPSTRKQYIRSWNLFFAFVPSKTISLPLAPNHLANFIAHLYEKGLQPSTICSHVSAISYVHKILNISDPTELFLIKKILKGCEKVTGTASSDTRLPITKNLLGKLMSSLPTVVSNHFQQLLLKAIFSVAFHGFFRLGELVVRIPENISKVLQRQDVQFITDNDKILGVELTLRFYKNNSANKPITIFLANKDHSGNFTNGCNCPICVLKQYLALFTHSEGPLFQYANGQAVTVQFVSTNLKRLTSFLGLNSNLYKGHSFRIGAATHFASLGYSEQYIQKLGRWHSNALQRYIRIDTFAL